MELDSKVKDIVNKVEDGILITKDEILHLLRIDHQSVHAGYIMAVANRINRAASNAKAEVHAQVGLNLSPCPNNCSFCAFAAENKIFREADELAVEDVVELALIAEASGANALLLMITADYPLGRFTEIASEVRSKLKPDTVMIANVGDFEARDGTRLKEAGFTGIYHAMRMGEGKDTKINPKTRLDTFKAAREAGLLLGTCLEPIGPEHSIEEMVEKILIGREAQPCYSGAGRRITIPGSRLERHGMISEFYMAYLVAVVRLAMGRDVIGNCTHEPNVLGATTGANLFWAEAGTNPRDTEEETSRGRGQDVKDCIDLFREADFDVLQGPSVIYSRSNIF